MLNPFLNFWIQINNNGMIKKTDYDDDGSMSTTTVSFCMILCDNKNYKKYLSPFLQRLPFLPNKEIIIIIFCDKFAIYY